MSSFNILFTAAGRRVSLLRHFKKTLTELNLSGHVIAADAGSSAPAGFIADDYVNVPRVSSPDYIDALVSVCKDKRIKLLVSLIDTDLTLLSENREIFKAIGTEVLVCSFETNQISFDKKNTYDFFVKNNIDTPYTYSTQGLEDITESDFPLLVKPWDGSCSVGVHVVNNRKELDFFKDYVDNAMVQEYVQGDEYTCDAYVDFKGKVRCVVPRLRLETRGGEVSKGVTVNDPDIINAVKDVVNKLPHAVGCITVQCFKQSNGRISFIEINPRFGGGHPLTIHAGADFPKWIIQELTAMECDAEQSSWKDDLVMLRYDDEVIVQGAEIR